MREGDDAIESFDTGAGSGYCLQRPCGSKRAGDEGPYGDPRESPRKCSPTSARRRGERASTSRFCGTTGGGQGVIHILVEDADTTRAALSEAGMEVSDERDVLVCGRRG